MKELLKYIIKRFITFVLHVFWIFRINQNKVFLMNDHSYNFSDNLKYLTLYLLDHSTGNYELYFSLKNPSGLEHLSVKPVRWFSFMHFYHALTSSVVITNNGGTAFMPFRKNQLVINTWHGGGPYKMTGVKALTRCFDKESDSESDASYTKDKSIYWYEKALAYNARKVDYILLSCKMCFEEIHGMFYTDNQALSIGNPRVDCLFDNNSSFSARDKVFKAFGIDPECKLIIYAPTFRGSFESYEGIVDNQELSIDINQILNAANIRFGGKWLFAVRLHPRLKDIELSGDGLINMTSYPDAQEILIASDMLITDYSSMMWDYSFMSKPCLLFAPDIYDYSVRRGFYLPPEEWPFPIAVTNDDLIDIISKFDFDDYHKKVNEHHNDVGSYESGHACESVKDIIDKHISSLKW